MTATGNRYSQSLGKTYDKFTSRLKSIITGKSLGTELANEIEEILLAADMGIKVVESVLEELKEKQRKNQQRKY